MAVVLESVSANGDFAAINSSSNLTVPKPTGLSVGDLMVAHISICDEDSNSGEVNPPSGWTALGNNILSDINGMAGMRVFYKVADASDAAASDFNFENASGEVMGMAGAIYRFSGASSTALQMTSANTSVTTTPTFANTVTPTFANSYLLFLVSGTDDNNPTTTSTYAITTDNPTWNEQYDDTTDLTGSFGTGNAANPFMAGAAASRPQTSATGNSTCTLSFDANYICGAIVVIPPVVNATPTIAVLELTSSAPDPAISGSASVTISSELSLSASVQSPTVSTPSPSWTEQSKNAGSWTEINKS